MKPKPGELTSTFSIIWESREAVHTARAGLRLKALAQISSL